MPIPAHALLLAGGAAAAAFVPTDDATLWAWWDSSNAGSITVDGLGRVTYVVNGQGTSTRDLALAAGSQNPTWNNGPFVFDGGDDNLPTSSVAIPAHHHVFAVVKPTVYNEAYTSIVEHWGAGNNGYGFLVTSTGKLALYNGTTNYDGSGSHTLSTGTRYLVEFAFDGTNLNGYVNAAADGNASGAFAISDTTALLVGASIFGSGRNWGGDIEELIICSEARTGANQSNMQNYLNNKRSIY